MLEVLYREVKDKPAHKENDPHTIAETLNARLKKGVTDERILEDIQDWISMYVGIKERESFFRGFRCAAELMLECYQGPDHM